MALKFIQIHPDGSVTEFSGSQNGADKAGYIEIDETDARYDAHVAAQAKVIANAPILANIMMTDSQFVRGMEDLIAALINKGTITALDLPPALVTRIQQRQALRVQLV